MSAMDFKQLLEDYRMNQLNEAQRSVFEQLLHDGRSEGELQKLLDASLQGIPPVHAEETQEYLYEQIKELNNIQKAEQYIPVHYAHRVHFLRHRWLRYAAAVIVLLGGAIAIVVSDRQSDKTGSKLSEAAIVTDIPAGGERAILTLSDGSTILLDSASDGQLTQQGNARVVKLANGQIVYNVNGSSQKEVILNTMRTPVGGQYQVILPDGTKVWLNAASSITFPTSFVTKDRQVKITGEAYFEVAKNKQKPFIVDVDGKSIVEVLGTSFNINSYPDEGNVKTTLLEGKVRVVVSASELFGLSDSKAGSAVAGSSNRQSGLSGTDNAQSVYLKPGEQAIIRNTSGNIVKSDADIVLTLSWKNGLFNFTGLNVREVMRQLERWYDIKVEYQGEIPKFLFRGKMYRSANLSEVLKMLEKMEVNCRMEGKTLIVL